MNLRPRSGFPSHKKRRSSAAKSKRAIHFLMAERLFFLSRNPWPGEKKTSFNRALCYVLRLFASSPFMRVLLVGDFRNFDHAESKNKTTASGTLSESDICCLSSSHRLRPVEGERPSQHQIQPNNTSSHGTKSANIWPINTIPQTSTHTHTPWKTHAQNLVDTHA